MELVTFADDGALNHCSVFSHNEHDPLLNRNQLTILCRVNQENKLGDLTLSKKKCIFAE